MQHDEDNPNSFPNREEEYIQHSHGIHSSLDQALLIKTWGSSLLPYDQ